MISTDKCVRLRQARLVLAFPLLLFVVACNRTQVPDSPRLTAKVEMRNITFHSRALNRDMQYRVVLPATMPSGQKLKTILLLHGRGGNSHDWSNYSDVTRFAENGLILVMPDGESSYYTNSVDHPQDRFEDYIVDDLISDVQSRLPANPGRESRAIVGVSMGGYGAVKLALKHPELFGFAGGLSSAIDVPSRPYSSKRADQWDFYRSIFGPWGSQTQRDNDPFVLARSADPTATPFLFLSCGEQEGLLAANRQFAALLKQRQFQFEFHSVPGSHDWNQWNAELPILFESLSNHLSRNGQSNGAPVARPVSR